MGVCGCMDSVSGRVWGVCGGVSGCMSSVSVCVWV